LKAEDGGGNSARRLIPPSLSDISHSVGSGRGANGSMHHRSRRHYAPESPGHLPAAGDDIRPSTADSPTAEYLAIQNALRRKARHLYFGRIGYVTQPKPDRRGEPFVHAEVLESRLGIACLHIQNRAVRNYFYSADHGQDETNQPTLYAVLRTLPTATAADLRLSYRMRRIELEADDSARSELQRAERAFNLLAHPELRSCYDVLLINPDAPALFPYGGFGHLIHPLAAFRCGVARNAICSHIIEKQAILTISRPF
jgi:hypothetical protein